MLGNVKSVRNKQISLITDDISKRIQQHIKSPELTRFAYSVVNKRYLGAPTLYSNYPTEWIDKYITMTLYKYDPVLTIARQSIMPFSWNESSLAQHRRHHCDIFKVAKKYNIVGGYTFPLHDHENNLATLTLYTEGDAALLQQTMEDNKHDIQLLLLTIHERYLLEKSNNNNNLRGTIEKKLTSREIEVLRWASIGKTYSEIAVIMGITESTVKFHVGNLIVKMDVVNAKHAIKMASDLHLFSFYE